MTIRSKLISSFLLMVFTIITVFTLYIYMRETRSIRSEIIKRGSDVSKIFTQMAVPLLFSMDYISILDNANELILDSDIISVTVADETGNILVDTGKPLSSQINMAAPFYIYKKTSEERTQKYREIQYEGERAIEFISLIAVFGKPAGVVRIVISLKTLEKRVSESLLSIALLSAGAIMLTLILAKMLLKLFDPIKVLVQGTHEISDGNLEYKISVSSDDEIGQLTKSFNSMAERIRSLVDNLEDKVNDRTFRLAGANEEIKRKTVHIMDSIRYAEKIQKSMLPDMETVRHYLPDSFFIWMPRDMVGGDTYFAECFGDGFVVALIDCTGHGIPGAFMSMIASSFIRKITGSEQCHDPAEILRRLNYNVKTSLQQDKAYAISDDGMDAAVCFITSRQTGDSRQELTFAGARLSLTCVHKDEISVIKGDRQSIGYKKSDLNFSFTNHTIPVEKGTSFYMASDGFRDQFGKDADSRFGERSFGKKRFRNLLRKVADMPFEKQQEIILRTFSEYRGECDIQDDVTVIGFGFQNQDRIN